MESLRSHREFDGALYNLYIETLEAANKLRGESPTRPNKRTDAELKQLQKENNFYEWNRTIPGDRGNVRRNRTL